LSMPPLLAHNDVRDCSKKFSGWRCVRKDRSGNNPRKHQQLF
jgi:hypothetical protein